jgi:ribosomal protein S18 acetylase RimI-like enzyme
MEADMETIKLNPGKKKEAAEVIAAAFFDYPMFTCYFPDPEKRARILPWYLENVLTCALHYGEVYTTPEISGVIFTLPPGHTKISLGEYLKNGFLLTPFVLGFRDFVRSQECEQFVADTHESVMDQRPHYYLWGLAVDPDHKRKRIGTALMQPFIDKVDAEEKPTYLETHDERNVGYYQRMGFSLVHTDRIPKYDLTIWCMVREPLKLK